MNESRPDRWESRLAQTAAQFPYPPTPDLRPAPLARSGRGQRAPMRRLAYIAAALLLLVGLWAVPPVRATVQDTVQDTVGQLWQLGAVGLRLAEPTPQATVAPLPTYPPLAGETTLAAAREQVNFPIRLPAYPSDLGRPHAVYLQELGGPAVILVWLTQADGQEAPSVRMSLTLFEPDTFVEKSLMSHTLIQETHVHDVPALWMQGEHILQFKQGDYQATQLVAGKVLIWTEALPDDGTLTYRLESGLPLDDAVRIAESVR